MNPVLPGSSAGKHCGFVSCRIFWILAVVGMAALNCAAQLPLTGNLSIHDPSTMIQCSNRYYIFYTGLNISSKSSPDKINWSGGPSVFNSSTRPAWTTNAVPGFTGTFWAPDIIFLNGQYYLYYSVSTFGSQTSAIGLATSPTLDPANPAYLWTDQGPIIQSNGGVNYNTIDPSVHLATDGRFWMTFGSFWTGIKMVELDPATGKRSTTNLTVYSLATHPPSTAIEGSCLVQHSNYYYLFVNWDTCCSGIDSTYNIRVGRSTNVTGPYLDRSGLALSAGGGTTFLESTGRFIGPGHAGIYSEGVSNWFTYHYYDGNASGNATLGMGRLYWDTNDWPQLTNDWCAFYTLEVDAREHRALYNGQLQNGATMTNEPGRSGVLNLNGAGQYVSLPISVANTSTFATWVKWNGGANWQRIFDFGNGTNKYLFLTPSATSGKMRFAITTNGAGGEKIIEGPAALPAGAWCHVAVTLDGARGVIYLNGDPVGTNASLTLRPWQLLARTNYLGKSQFPTDPAFAGMLDSVRIFGRALAGAEIKTLALAHPSLAHRYSFAGDASDSIGSASGDLQGGAVVTNHALTLNGSAGNYANLPGGLVNGCAAVTIEFWAGFGANGNWSRVFDFGNTNGVNGQQYLFFTPHTASTSHRFSISTGGGASDLDAANTLDGRNVFVACIAAPANGYSAIYTNGVLEKAMTGTLPPLSGISPALSWLGRSLFTADAWLNGSIDEFRIYDGRLSPAEIVADYTAGPDQLALLVSLSVSNSPAGVTLSWPAYATGFALQSSASSDATAVWSPVPQTPSLAGGQFQLTLSPAAQTQYFRLRR